MTTRLVEVLQQVPDLEVTSVDSDILKTEIQFRVDSNWWTSKLQILTRAFPDVHFTKRYITEGDRFGFRWSILKFGQLEEENWNELAENFSYLLFEVQETPKKIAKPSVKSSSRDNRKVVKRTVYDTEGDNSPIGEVMDFPIPHIFNELNKPQPGGGRGASRIGDGKKTAAALREMYPEMGQGATG